MTLQRLDRKDLRLAAVSAIVAAVSLYVGVKYFFSAFPEASIEFSTTKATSRPIAEAFLSGIGLDTASLKHAAVFDFDQDTKTFMERELGVERSSELLKTTVRLWRWRHRWFRPLQKEEMRVDVTTKGELVAFAHLLPEEAEGADLPEAEARRIAEGFLSGTMHRPLEELEFVEGRREKRPKRTDHAFTWRVKGSDVEGADYRVEVDVAGDRVSRHDESLKVPESWKRSYEELQYWNLTTGAVDVVFLLMTAVAMLVVLVLRVMRGDVRMKPAAILGGVTFLLVLVSQLNELPSELFRYVTTDSYAGFILRELLSSVSSGLLYGAIIFLLAAAAEPLYRERFRGALSLGSLLRWRALRTKEFFIATLVGLTMTCFFFAYENVFYIIANSFGAWAPRDVPYSDLLSTAVPWVFVLFFGWFPAISEEFMSRMFSIPFFEKVLRSRVGAIVVAAAIWGFGHAAYPNQPFWIRGLEVGIAGIVFGLVFLRFGILPVVIAHFSIDALYTAFVLIRSGNVYHVLTGSLSAGIFGILFLGMLAAYLRKGGFLPPEITNEAEDAAAPIGAVGAARSAAADLPFSAPDRAADGVEAGGGDPVTRMPGGGARQGRPVAVYERLSGARIAVALVIAAGLVASRFVPIDHFGDWVDFTASRQRSVETAAVFLRSAGFDVATYRHAASTLDRTDPAAAAYLLESGGLALAKEVYRDRVPTPLWRTRFFVPGQKEEYVVSIDPARGSVVGFTRELPEDAPGATLEKEEALERAERFAASMGQDPKGGELKEQTSKDEKARRDHTLVWEYAVPGGREARVRYAVVVQGDTVGSWTRSVKIPEEWRREREKETALTVLLKWLKVPFLGLVVGFAIVVFIQKVRGREVPWKLALIAGAIFALCAAARSALSIGRIWMTYDTSFPDGLFRVAAVVGIVIVATGFLIGGILAAAAAGALWPAFGTMLSRRARTLYARDALVAGAVSVGCALGVPALVRLAEMALPSGIVIGGAPAPNEVDASVPALMVLAGALSNSVLVPAAAAIASGLIALYFRSTIARALLCVFLVFSFLPSSARRPSEYILGAVAVAIVSAGVLLLARYVLRSNPLAWVWSAWFTFGTIGALRLIEQSAGPYRQNGIIAMIVVLAPSLLLARDALSGRGSGE